jgi:hypothetical protein
MHILLFSPLGTSELKDNDLKLNNKESIELFLLSITIMLYVTPTNRSVSQRILMRLIVI